MSFKSIYRFKIIYNMRYTKVFEFYSTMCFNKPAFIKFYKLKNINKNTCILLRRRQLQKSRSESGAGHSLKANGVCSDVILRASALTTVSQALPRQGRPARRIEEALPRTRHRLRVPPHCSHFLPRGWRLAQSEEQRGWHPHQNQTSDQKYWTRTVYTRKLSHKNTPSRS